jgi:hypothetical protein
MFEPDLFFENVLRHTHKFDKPRVMCRETDFIADLTTQRPWYPWNQSLECGFGSERYVQFGIFRGWYL